MSQNIEFRPSHHTRGSVGGRSSGRSLIPRNRIHRRGRNDDRETNQAASSSAPQASMLSGARDVSIHGGNIVTAGGHHFDVNVNLNVGNEDGDMASQSMAIGNRETRSQYELPIAFQQPPSQSACEVYYRNLALKKRGSPLWIPEPNNNLSLQYRKKGVSIGDVGLLSPSGNFDFFFNICLPHDHPINDGGVPDGFKPVIPPVSERDYRGILIFKPDSYLASESIIYRHSEVSSSPGLTFESSADEGAVLTMPHGAYSEDLITTFRFKKYMSENVESWYTYLNQVRGCEAQNGDIRLVIGCDKTDAWGTATRVRSTIRMETVLLTFQPAENSGRAYKWEYSGSVETRTGPEIHEIAELHQDEDIPEEVKNQCLFVRTLNANLQDDVWERLCAAIDSSTQIQGVSNSYIQSLPILSIPRSSTSSQNQPTMSYRCSTGGSMRGNTVLSATPRYLSNVSPTAMMAHPSNVINDLLLRRFRHRFPTAKMVITEDNDWISVMKSDDSSLPQPIDLFSQIMVSDIMDRVSIEEDVLFISSIVQEIEGQDSTDPREASPNSSTLILSALEDVTSTSLTELKSTALLALRILTDIPAMTGENKRGCERLGYDLGCFIVAIWLWNRTAKIPQHWLSTAILKDVTQTLEFTRVFVEEQLSRNETIHAVLRKDSDAERINQYRRNLDDLISKFERKSNMKVNEVPMRLTKKPTPLRDYLDADMFWDQLNLAPPITSKPITSQSSSRKEDRFDLGAFDEAVSPVERVSGKSAPFPPPSSDQAMGQLNEDILCRIVLYLSPETLDRVNAVNRVFFMAWMKSRYENLTFVKNDKAMRRLLDHLGDRNVVAYVTPYVKRVFIRPWRIELSPMHHRGLVPGLWINFNEILHSDFIDREAKRHLQERLERDIALVDRAFNAMKNVEEYTIDWDEDKRYHSELYKAFFIPKLQKWAGHLTKLTIKVPQELLKSLASVRLTKLETLEYHFCTEATLAKDIAEVHDPFIVFVNNLRDSLACISFISTSTSLHLDMTWIYKALGCFPKLRSILLSVPFDGRHLSDPLVFVGFLEKHRSTLRNISLLTSRPTPHSTPSDRARFNWIQEILISITTPFSQLRSLALAIRPLRAPLTNVSNFLEMHMSTLDSLILTDRAFDLHEFKALMATARGPFDLTGLRHLRVKLNNFCPNTLYYLSTQIPGLINLDIECSSINSHLGDLSKGTDFKSFCEEIIANKDRLVNWKLRRMAIIPQEWVRHVESALVECMPNLMMATSWYTNE